MAKGRPPLCGKACGWHRCWGFARAWWMALCWRPISGRGRSRGLESSATWMWCRRERDGLCRPMRLPAGRGSSMAVARLMIRGRPWRRCLPSVRSAPCKYRWPHRCACCWGAMRKTALLTLRSTGQPKKCRRCSSHRTAIIQSSILKKGCCGRVSAPLTGRKGRGAFSGYARAKRRMPFPARRKPVSPAFRLRRQNGRPKRCPKGLPSPSGRNEMGLFCWLRGTGRMPLPRSRGKMR